MSFDLRDPWDYPSRVIYADWLDEQGREDEATYQRRCAEALKVLGRNGALHLREQLAIANGRRRVRILDFEDCLFAIHCCLNSVDGIWWNAGETVSNAYGHTATRTVFVVVRRTDGGIRWGVAKAGARRGSSPVSKVCPGLRADSSVEKFREWADAEGGVA